MRDRTQKLQLTFGVAVNRHKVEGIENSGQNFDSLLLVRRFARLAVEVVHQDGLVLLPTELGAQGSDATNRSLKTY